MIAAQRSEVWKALVDPDAIQQYMFGTRVESTWTPGARITWKGEWNGKPYEDKGTILAVEPETRLAYSHFSPMSGMEDLPENYHNVTVTLETVGDGTLVTLSQDGNRTEEAKEHSERNWASMLHALKKHVDGAGSD